MSTSNVPEGTGRLTLSSFTPGTQFTVLDSALRPVETSSDWREQVLTAGVYQVEGRVGSSTLQRLVTVGPGSTVSEDLNIHFSTAAPTFGAATTNETHGDLAFELSNALAQSGGPDAGLVLQLRTLAGSEPTELHSNDLTVLDRAFQPISEWTSDWLPDRYGKAVAKAARLDPGPYVLRTTRRAQGITEQIDQTIWLANGWQTLVFVPNTTSGPDPRGLSVHMTRLSQPWHPNDDEAGAVEAALAGLRDGVYSIDNRTTFQLLYSKFHNPMLGIIGLHALLLSPHPDDNLVQTVLHNLMSLVGDHPDVMAVAASREDGLPETQVSWPPMLEHSYRACLLPADLRHPGTVADGSLAQSIAPLIRIPGPWLRWTGDPEPRARRFDDESIGDVIGDVAGPLEAPPEYINEAYLLVQRTVDELSDFHQKPAEDVVAAVGLTELARRTGLTTTLLNSCLRILGLDPHAERHIEVAEAES